jgi:hypothetical protein
MQYPDVKNSKEEEDHWIGLSDFERERFERRADFLIDQGYVAVDPLTLAVKVAWKLRDSPQPEGLVYEDHSRTRREADSCRASRDPLSSRREPGAGGGPAHAAPRHGRPSL